MKRVFLIVLDSVGIGELPDAADYGDAGSNTMRAISKSKYFDVPNLKKLGLNHLDGVDYIGGEDQPFDGAVVRLAESSKGKDTTIGHWEISGMISNEPLPTFPNGFPDELISQFEEKTGRKVICNKPYSGTKVLEDYGEEHLKTGALIVYTSADSVFQVAAHDSIVPVEKLYEYCEIARELCQGKYGVGRVIARPFIGEPGNFSRTSKRHDYSLQPPKVTMLDQLKDGGFDVLAVGKISDIFAGKGITDMVRTDGNADGIEKTIQYAKQDFNGLCFVNLVDFDMLYGHRNDVDGYAKALSYFDSKLPDLMKELKEDDILMITADHGCDPSTASTDHSREYTPLLIYGDKIEKNKNLGTRKSFSDISATILEYFGVEKKTNGDSFLNEVMK